MDMAPNEISPPEAPGQDWHCVEGPDTKGQQSLAVAETPAVAEKTLARAIADFPIAELVDFWSKQSDTGPALAKEASSPSPAVAEPALGCGTNSQSGAPPIPTQSDIMKSFVATKLSYPQPPGTNSTSPAVAETAVAPKPSLPQPSIKRQFHATLSTVTKNQTSTICPFRGESTL